MPVVSLVYYIAPEQWNSALRKQHVRVAVEHKEYRLVHDKNCPASTIRRVPAEYREAQGDQPAGWYGSVSGESDDEEQESWIA